MALDVPSADSIDLSARSFWEAPADARERAFAVLRRERPVSWHGPPESVLVDAEDSTGGYWAVVRHEDVTAVSRAPEIFSSGARSDVRRRSRRNCSRRRSRSSRWTRPGTRRSAAWYGPRSHPGRWRESRTRSSARAADRRRRRAPRRMRLRRGDRGAPADDDDLADVRRARGRARASDRCGQRPRGLERPRGDGRPRAGGRDARWSGDADRRRARPRRGARRPHPART